MDVVLESAGPDAIRVVRAVAALLEVDAFAAMDLVDQLPAVLLSNVDPTVAEAAAQRLREAGATVSLRGRQ